MPNPVLTQAITEAYAYNTNLIIFETLEFSHSALLNPAYAEQRYITNNGENIVATLESNETVTFYSQAFTNTLPATGANSSLATNLVIDNIGQEFVTLLETITKSNEPAFALYRPYLSNDLSRPQFDPPIRYVVLGATVKYNTISISVGYQDFVNVPFPRVIYTVKDFPGLAR